MSYQQTILDAIKERFLASTVPDTVVEWERVEHYAIDDSARMKATAIGMVDQGQRFGFKVSNTDITWRVAIEFFVRSNAFDDIQSVVNDARAEVYRIMMHDVTWGGLTVDTSPIADEIFVDWADSFGEGVLLFDIRYRTRTKDIAKPL